MTDELPFRVVRSNSYDETLARCTNLPIAQAAYRGRAGDCEEQVKGAQLVTGRESIGCSPPWRAPEPEPLIKSGRGHVRDFLMARRYKQERPATAGVTRTARA